MARNKPPGWLGSRRRYSMIVDVTHSETPLCVSEAVAVEGTAVSARLTATRFFGAFFGNSAQPTVDSTAGLDLREGCAGSRRALCRLEP
jgi:hypothetical protein